MTESTDLVTYRVEPAQPGADGLVAYLTLNDPTGAMRCPTRCWIS